jgi:hypothetical protein
MQDYWLGGKDNFAADREAAERAMTLAPELPRLARENRKFLARAVRFLAAAGIDQFIDIGTGLPTQGHVHEVLHDVAPEARVAYVDNDPVVMAHARALLEGYNRAVAVQGDVQDPDGILADRRLRELIDLDRPVGILLISILHLIEDDELTQRILTRLRDAVAPGSYITIAHAVSGQPEKDETIAKLADLYHEKAMKGNTRRDLRTEKQVLALFDGMELVEPGLVKLPEWRPEAGAAVDVESFWVVGGVAKTL